MFCVHMCGCCSERTNLGFEDSRERNFRMQNILILYLLTYTEEMKHCVYDEHVSSAFPESKFRCCGFGVQVSEKREV